MHPDPADLSRHELFKGLDEAQLQQLASWFEVEEFSAGRAIIRDGAAGYAFYVIDAGTVRVDLEGRDPVMLGPGAPVGEMAFFGDGRRNAEVTAETDGRMLAMFGTRFRELQLELPAVAEQLESLVTQRSA
ncbi:MAG TPA: cyclic nucleotide-binding domain-containing protein [Gaiellales bacterium]|nr:cyclic nucleotide-binding domain-containing protein [Gaiellales bacterium]